MPRHLAPGTKRHQSILLTMMLLCLLGALCSKVGIIGGLASAQEAADQKQAADATPPEDDKKPADGKKVAVDKKQAADQKQAADATPPEDHEKPADGKKPAVDKKQAADQKQAADATPPDDEKPADGKKPAADKKSTADKKPTANKKAANDKKPVTRPATSTTDKKTGESAEVEALTKPTSASVSQTAAVARIATVAAEAAVATERRTEHLWGVLLIMLLACLTFLAGIVVISLLIMKKVSSIEVRTPKTTTNLTEGVIYIPNEMDRAGGGKNENIEADVQKHENGLAYETQSRSERPQGIRTVDGSQMRIDEHFTKLWVYLSQSFSRILDNIDVLLETVSRTTDPLKEQPGADADVHVVEENAVNSMPNQARIAQTDAEVLAAKMKLTDEGISDVKTSLSRIEAQMENLRIELQALREHDNAAIVRLVAATVAQQDSQDPSPWKTDPKENILGAGIDVRYDAKKHQIRTPPVHDQEENIRETDIDLRYDAQKEQAHSPLAPDKEENTPDAGIDVRYGAKKQQVHSPLVPDDEENTAEIGIDVRYDAKKEQARSPVVPNQGNTAGTDIDVRYDAKKRQARSPLVPNQGNTPGTDIDVRYDAKKHQVRPSLVPDQGRDSWSRDRVVSNSEVDRMVLSYNIARNDKNSREVFEKTYPVIRLKVSNAEEKRTLGGQDVTVVLQEAENGAYYLHRRRDGDYCLPDFTVDPTKSYMRTIGGMDELFEIRPQSTKGAGLEVKDPAILEAFNEFGEARWRPRKRGLVFA